MHESRLLWQGDGRDEATNETYVQMENKMAFGDSGPLVLCIFEEAQISVIDISEELSYPSTRRLDFVSIAEESVSTANIVAILKCIDEYPYPSDCNALDNYVAAYDKVISFNVVPTTAKANTTFSCPGNNQQAVQELLALTEVLIRETGNVKMSRLW